MEGACSGEVASIANLEPLRSRRTRALACDYDGTLANRGVVDRRTLQALQRFRESGRRLVLVTGRRLDDLQEVFQDLELFDRVIAENGALLYNPGSGRERLLARGPAHALMDALERRRVRPLDVGRVIIATTRPYLSLVRALIRDLGLRLEVIVNKRSIMVLPEGTDKGSGLIEAARELRLKKEEIVGIGDAENDVQFLALCGFSVVVGNGLAQVKRTADAFTSGRFGAGVVQVIDAVLSSGATAPRGFRARARRHSR